MTPAQLTLDGSSPRAPRRLTERQRAFLRHVRYWNDTAGAYPTGQTFAHYVDGYSALRRLERVGLLRRGEKGEWWAA